MPRETGFPFTQTRLKQTFAQIIFKTSTPTISKQLTMKI